MALDAAERSGSAALDVLTNGALLRHATGFVGGVSGFVLAFVRRIEPQVAPKYALSSRPGWRGVLPFMAVKEDDLRVLQALLALRHQPQYAANVRLQPHRLVLAAARYGRLRVLRWLQIGAEDVPWDPGLLREAISHRRVDIMDWLFAECPHERTGGSGVQHIDWQAHERTLAVVIWLHTHGFAFSTREMDYAAEFGHLDVVAFLHAQRTEGCTVRAMDAAAEYGWLAIVEFLHTYRTEGCTTHAMDGAAARGHVAIVSFLHTHRSEGCTVRAMDQAAVHSHASVVAFLGQHRREGCSSTTLLQAAKSSSARTVQALCEYSVHGCLVDAKRVAVAWEREDVVALLDAAASERVRTCATALHTPSDSRRRCQRLSSHTVTAKETRHPHPNWRLRSVMGSLWGPDSALLRLWPPSMLLSYPNHPI